MRFLGVVLLWALLGHIDTSQAQPNQVIVRYDLEAEQIVLHEPAIIRFSARNESSETVQLDLGNDRKGSFLFLVTLPGGKQVTLPRFYREGFSRTGIVSIGPGEEYIQRLLLNQWNDFDIVGKYNVRVRLTEPIRAVQGRVVGAVSSYSADLEVLPRNPGRLKETCELLLRRALVASSYEETAEAANELSYVRDPIAVPYLAGVLNAGRMVERQAIDGLRRIANQDAVGVLILSLGSGPSDTSSHTESMAAGALGMIWLETRNPKIKETIEQAFSRSGLKLPEIGR